MGKELVKASQYPVYFLSVYFQESFKFNVHIYIYFLYTHINVHIYIHTYKIKSLGLRDEGTDKE